MLHIQRRCGFSWIIFSVIIQLTFTKKYNENQSVAEVKHFFNFTITEHMQIIKKNYFYLKE